jgi:hypothetical protein
MLTARMCESGKDAGKWFSLMTRPGVPELRVGYCARGCAGHASSEEALAHHFQFQLDRETDLWMVRTDDRKCEICGTSTALRARLGRDTKLFALCGEHQSSSNLRALFQCRRRRSQQTQRCDREQRN